jgi:hypothetical protein
MSIYYLPARTDVPHYDFDVDLEGAIYALELYWNSRAGAWFLSVSDVNGTPIVSGRKVVLGAPLLGRGVLPAGPPGILVAYDSSGQDQEAGQNDLGARVQLVYYESMEFA